MPCTWQVNVTRYFLRCIADYCAVSASGTRSNDDELEAALCVSLTAYSHECTSVNNVALAWRMDYLCRKHTHLLRVQITMFAKSRRTYINKYKNLSVYKTV